MIRGSESKCRSSSLWSCPLQLHAATLCAAMSWVGTSLSRVESVSITGAWRHCDQASATSCHWQSFIVVETYLKVEKTWSTHTNQNIPGFLPRYSRPRSGRWIPEHVMRDNARVRHVKRSRRIEFEVNVEVMSTASDESRRRVHGHHTDRQTKAIYNVLWVVCYGMQLSALLYVQRRRG